MSFRACVERVEKQIFIIKILKAKKIIYRLALKKACMSAAQSFSKTPPTIVVEG